MKLSEAKQIEKLNAEIFKASEPLQGDAWISDEAGVKTLTEFFDMVEGHLWANREASQAIAAFLRKHRSLRKAAGRAALASPAREKE